MCSKSLVKDLVYEEPFGFRVVHHMLLTFFLQAIYVFIKSNFQNHEKKNNQ